MSASISESVSDAAFSGAPVLTGLELFERAGALAELGFCDEISGLYAAIWPDGSELITSAEWMAYKVWCRAAERVDPLAGAPMVSMMVVEAEEEASYAKATEPRAVRPDDRQRIYRSLSTVLGEVLTLVGAARVTLCAEDEESALDEAERKLELCRVCVQGLCRNDEAGMTNEEDVARLSEIEELEWLRDVVVRAGAFMGSESSWDECGAVAQELSEAAKKVKQNRAGEVKA